MKHEKFHNRELPDCDKCIPKPFENKWKNVTIFYDMDLKIKLRNNDTGEIITVFDVIKEHDIEKKRVLLDEH